jgi:hypothetical protein
MTSKILLRRGIGAPERTGHATGGPSGHCESLFRNLLLRSPAPPNCLRDPRSALGTQVALLFGLGSRNRDRLCWSPRAAFAGSGNQCAGLLQLGNLSVDQSKDVHAEQCTVRPFVLVTSVLNCPV